MKCPNCGTENEDHARVCKVCGESLLNPMDDSFSWADTVDVWNGVEGLPEENTEQSEKVLKKKQRRKESVEDVIKESDFISLHVPANNNKYLIDENEFRKMKSNAIIINTARGKLINENALIKALKDKLILGAAIDVYENEKQINPDLLHLDNILLSPHNGTGTVEARIQSAEKASKNIYNYFYGDKNDLDIV